MATSFPSAAALSPRAFDRHIKRLAWCALLGSLTLLIPLFAPPSYIGWGLTEALGALLVVIAVLDVVRDISRYIRHENARRRDAVRASAHAGACRTADAIQDRVANLLSVTVGYVEFVTEDEQLDERTLEHARQARDSALAAARTLSAFRHSLGCGPASVQTRAEWSTPSAGRPAVGSDAISGRVPWSYDDSTRSIRAQDGTVIASLRRFRDRSAEVRTGRLIAEAPALWSVLAEAQRVSITFLAEPRGHAEQAPIRELLEHINAVTDSIEL